MNISYTKKGYYLLPNLRLEIKKDLISESMDYLN